MGREKGNGGVQLSIDSCVRHVGKRLQKVLLTYSPNTCLVLTLYQTEY